MNRADIWVIFYQRFMDFSFHSATEDRRYGLFHLNSALAGRFP